jgi:hypothetical protein
MWSAWLGARAGLLALAFMVTCAHSGWADESAQAEDITDPPAPSAEPGDASPKVGTRKERLRARAQLHRNGLRGVAFVSTWYPDRSKEPDQIRMVPRVIINLDGDPRINVWGNVYPIDVDGDGRYELLHYNGHRIMRVYRQDGSKLWELETANWRTNRSAWHRDTLAVFDADGDGGEDIVHCWNHADYPSKVLVSRRGSNGKVLNRVALEGTPRSEECQVAAFYVAGRQRPLILVAGHSRKGSGCHAPWVDTWSRVTAFDADLRQQWERETCAAGHYAWPVDENTDGLAEGIFVGKYLLRPDGSLACTLPGWGRNHVDSLSVGDFNRDLKGYEAVAVGYGVGTVLYSQRGCEQRWRIPSDGKIVDPQTVAAARLLRGHGWPSLFVTESGKASKRHTFQLSPLGEVEESYRTGDGAEVQFQNANIDGARSIEDRVSRWGEVIAPDGSTRLGRGWYWNLDRLGGEKPGKPQDRWAYTPLVFDYDGDGRDELTVWGRRLLVIGQAVD